MCLVFTQLILIITSCVPEYSRKLTLICLRKMANILERFFGSQNHGFMSSFIKPASEVSELLVVIETGMWQ